MQQSETTTIHPASLKVLPRSTGGRAELRAGWTPLGPLRPRPAPSLPKCRILSFDKNGVSDVPYPVSKIGILHRRMQLDGTPLPLAYCVFPG